MKFLTTSQAAKRLKLTRQGVGWLIRHNRLPAQMMGTEYLISEEDIKAFLRKRKVKTSIPA